MQQLQVLFRNLTLLHRIVANPIQQSLPVSRVKEDHGEVADLLGLNQRQCFKEFVERAKTARKDNETKAVLDEHHLPYEEVLEGEPASLVRIRALLKRQFYISANR